MRTEELDFDLPESLIATEPSVDRDGSRLLVVSRSDPSRLEHHSVRDLPALVPAQAMMVFNATRVRRARFLGRNRATGGRVEGLYLGAGDTPGTSVVMLKARRHRVGAIIDLESPAGRSLELLGASETEQGAWIVRSVSDGSNEVGDDLSAWLEQGGEAPLPPYILSARQRQGMPQRRDDDIERYQTVYADSVGSVAAPTAGLHFTPRLLEELDAKGIERSRVLLHVGRGTFQNVETERVEDHPMHEEVCEVAEPVAQAIMNRGARPVLAVGTTTARTLESFAGRASEGGPAHGSMRTSLLITPGYEWRWTDALMTNFHMPKSTLLAMVSSLFPEGIDRLREIYDAAIAERYRFFSYGDAMLVLP